MFSFGHFMNGVVGILSAGVGQGADYFHLCQGD